MHPSKLKNAPLQEVVFEMFWKPTFDESGQPLDAGFQLAQGVFASQIEKEFPIRIRLLPEFLNVRIFRYLVYQFRQAESEWPLIQFGPGVMSVNDTDKNYMWKENFLPNIKFAIKTLQASYEEKLQLERVRLLYIDAVEFDSEKLDASAFIEQNLRTVAKNNYQPSGVQKSIQIAQTFELKHQSQLQLNIQNGVVDKTGNPAIIWTTAVERSGDLKFNALPDWLDFAHETASNTFVKMLNPDFYAGFTT